MFIARENNFPASLRRSDMFIANEPQSPISLRRSDMFIAARRLAYRAP